MHGMGHNSGVNFGTIRTAFGDAGEQANLGFVNSQAEYIETKVYNHKYYDIKYPELIPVDTSAHPWSKTVSYYSMDYSGQAEWAGDHTQDIATIGTEYGQAITQVYMANIGYDFGIEEVNQARMYGLSLESQKAMIAKHEAERLIDRVAFFGDTQKNFLGLFNQPIAAGGSLTPVNHAVAAAAWSDTSDPDTMLADLNNATNLVSVATGQIVHADTLILPHQQLQIASRRRLGSVNDTTVLKFFKENNIYKTETGNEMVIRSHQGLANAGVVANKPTRMVAYRYSDEAMKLHIPLPLMFLEAQRVGLKYQVPGIFRLGGFDNRLPKETSYTDGI